MPTPQKKNKKKGCLALGYRSEHFRIAGQMAVAIVAAMLFVVIDPLYNFLGEYAVWIVITVVVAFSPNVGSALSNAVIGLLGSIVGGALGMMIIALISGLALGYSYETHPVTMSVWLCVLMALVGFVLELNKERFRRLEYGYSVALLTFPLVAIPGFRANDERYVERLKLSLCGCIGVLLTVLSAAVVFPVRARTRLRKSTAHILENLGNLAFQLLGEFCQEPDEGMRMRGSSGTDVQQHYVDNGLQQALDGLHRAHLHLLKDVSDVAELIAPARAETRYLKFTKPRFPISTYKTIHRLCARILTALGSLHHSMESGHLRLGLCVVYRPLLEELRQNVAASLTALSGLVLGTLSEDYAREKMERLCASAVELQAALEREPMKAGYNMHVETLAIAAKTATNLARQVASMYMDLRPEAAHQIHSSLCGGTDRLPSRKSSSDGAPGSQQREDIPMTGQQLGGLPPKPGRGGGGGMASQQGDIELGMGGMIRRPPSSLASGRLSSISEDTSLDSSDGRRQTLQHLPEDLSTKVGSFLRSKSLPGPVLIPGSVFRDSLLPFAMPPPPQPSYTPYPEEPPATPPAPPSPAGAGPGHPDGGDASAAGNRPRLPQRPSNVREMLQGQTAAGSPPRDVALTQRQGQSLVPLPERGAVGAWPASAPAPGQPLHVTSADDGGAPELCKMTSLQRRTSPSAWLNSRSTSFKAEDNPFG
ncbi:hypothetical protein COCSUDRAFT_65088 [Coccomyxa subellipsoidea C-169]|uniref:DUF2421 domain-containing protein n=1 Tax=Coccomyxa subellipsoidea (strain C-169) TaxID=574566 RepID=I0Z368_COCSC|nr:hypothetical protein COCSUDRAFT_65088 [Coccomyxa subellipsoidea C-169]EIE25087.1 hypothetical protein COCSUDRAFT_65088 [Coccomyxa subellipsoidea C-169]|eukprot:XP_005649631.1 hypothetical protein COCSUDRAFT_65088 [Coccomyxa subellipsoidea C-169]